MKQYFSPQTETVFFSGDTLMDDVYIPATHSCLSVAACSCPDGIIVIAD